MSIRNGGKIIAGFGGSGGNGDSLNNQNPTSPIRQVYDWIGTLEEYEAQQVAELHPTWVCFILDDTIPKDKNLYTNRNVGDIFFTTRLDLLLNGAVECDGNTYSFEDFTGEQSIGNLLKDGKIPYVSLSQYASLLTDNGVVGVFGWDGGNSTTFRVPTLNNIFIEAGTAAGVGEVIPAGLPDIQGSVRTTPQVNGYQARSGAFTQGTYDSGYETNGLGSGAYWIGHNIGYQTWNFKASNSNAIYGKSSTVQPKSIKYRPMVQLSIGFTDEAVEKCMNVVNDVAELKEQQPHNLIDSMITNCITEIPQDIKLKLNNGTLTLIAGSKVYVPNGAGVFDTVTIANDIVRTASGDGTGKVLFYKNGTISVRQTVGIASGSTPPSSSLGQYLGWYDTTNNVIKLTSDGGSTWDSGWSFPLCITHDISGDVVLDQTFNGFGFIGTVVYALPGVKGLMPYGRNSDGSLKNKKVEFTSVIMRNIESNSGTCILTTNETAENIGVHWENSNQAYGYAYDKDNNYYYTTDPAGFGTNQLRIKLGTVVGDGTRLVSMDSKHAFQVVDYNETKIIVESMLPTTANNYTWYRKYSDGWVEQGGVITGLTNGSISWNSKSVSLPITMANTNYSIIASDCGLGANDVHGTYNTCSSITQWKYYYFNAASDKIISWQVSGMAAK